MTAEIKYKEQVLDAIDHLRKRKARPDESRIYNLLARRSALNYTDAKLALEKCIENGAVIRVDYKGGTSYRNAAKKYSHLKRDSQGEIIRDGSATAPTKFTGLLTKAITEFVLEEPDYLECGVPGAELIENILSKDSVRYNEGYVRILLDKEVATGSLIKMEDDRFLVGPAKTNHQRLEQNTVVSYEDEVMSDVAQACDASDVSEIKIRKKPGPKPGFKKDRIHDGYKKDDNTKRVTGRRKRAKKVFDPSDNNIPKKRGRPLGSLNKSTLERQARSSDNDSRPASRTSSSSYRDQGVCGVCHCNKRDRMVGCRDCNGKAHLSCVNGDDTTSPMCPDNTWQCFECKPCVLCHTTGRSEGIAVCGICADGYHWSCLSSSTERIKSGLKWLCKKCKVLDQLTIKDIHMGFESARKHQDEGMSSPSNSGNSSIENYRTPPQTPTPPRLSPQGHLNGHRISSPAFSIKSEDSPSCKDMDVEENIDPSIPDATYWTYDDVYNYFAQYFPEEEAKVFKEQEIDGRSLLLMKRSDVVRNLNLKLGPAVKMYKHVVTLQLRRDVPRLYLL